MNAGELTVRVKAELAEFDAGMRQMEQRASRAGEVGAASIRSKFSQLGSDIAMRAGKQLEGMTKTLLNPLMIADAVGRGFTQAIRTGNVAQAYVDMVSSLPIVGTFADTLTAIYDRVTGQAQDDTRLAPSRDVDDIRRRAAEKRRADEAALADDEKRRAQGISEVKKNLINLENDLQIAQFRERGDEEMAVAVEFEKRYREIQEEQNRLSQGASAEELKVIDRQFALKRDALDSEKRLAIKNIHERIREEKNATKEMNDKIAKDKRDADIKFLEESLDAVAEEMTAIEERRKEAQMGAVGEFQTALGTFKFDAYPDSEKRKNDIEMVNALKELVKRGLGLSEQRAALGFN